MVGDGALTKHFTSCKSMKLQCSQRLLLLLDLSQCVRWLISSVSTYLSVFVGAEILDFGYPQNSETGALKTFITQQGIKGQVSGTAVC